jgi:thymidylate kinase
VDALNAGEVRYCYWRSSRRVLAALTGESDLDLLVGKQSFHKAQRALIECGFKLFPSVASRDQPSVVSYLGHDEDSGAIVHVHLHARLVVGGALLKTHRLPWEDGLLDRAVTARGIPLRLLDPSTEAVLLVVRSCLELRRTDPVVLRRWSGATSKFERDRAALLGDLDRDAVCERARELLGAELGSAVCSGLYDPHPLGEQHALRRALRRELAKFRSYNAWEGQARTTWRALHLVFGTLNRKFLWWPRPWARLAPGGGVVVALLGVDGSGKSTLVRGLRAWLGSEVDVLPLYLGTGDGRPSLLLLPFKLLMPVASKLVRSKPRGSSHGDVSSAAPGVAYSMLLAAWAIVLAAEKRMKLTAANRAASRGMVVITDRFPQDQIAGFNDGPLLTRLERVPRWLRRFEASAYALARDLSPDLVIRLVASPELIASREPTMDATVIRRRVAELQLLGFPNSQVLDIDASQPVEQVLRLARRQVWSLL